MRERETHIDVFCGVKRSLTEPPATLRNAELKKPVMNLKIKYTAVDDGIRHRVCQRRCSGVRNGKLTDMRREGDWPGKDEEEEVGNTVDNTAAVQFGERTDEEGADC